MATPQAVRSRKKKTRVKGRGSLGDIKEIYLLRRCFTNTLHLLLINSIHTY